MLPDKRWREFRQNQLIDMRNYWVKYRSSIIFIFRFLFIYIILNVAYSWFFVSFYPQADPITYRVATLTKAFFHIFDVNVQLVSHADKPFISIMWNGSEILLLFEGCNGINVWIVFVSFLLAFGPVNSKLLMFILKGTGALCVLVILRLFFLFWVAVKIPDHFYLLHKYFFSAFLYLIVFALWYFWVRHTMRNAQ